MRWRGEMSGQAFDLNRFIDAELDRTLDPDPHVVAAKLAPKIPSAALRYVISRLLPDYVRGRLHYRRESIPVELLDEGTAKSLEGGPMDKPPRVPSRWDHIPEVYHAWLKDSICMSGHRSDWIFRGDMTLEHSDRMVTMHAKAARERAAKRDYWMEVSKALKAYGAPTVADLPLVVIAELAQLSKRVAKRDGVKV